MQIPWVLTFDEARLMFNTTSDAVVMDAYDLSAFDDEGGELDPVDGCRVIVRTARVVGIIRANTAWSPDAVI